MKTEKLSREYLGPNAQKVLLLLAGGLALGIAQYPRQSRFKILDNISKGWGKINSRALTNAIRALYKSKMIDGKDNSDGTTTLILNEKGKQKVLAYDIEKITIPTMKIWDKKWRIVFSDIPEKFKKARNAFAYSLRKMNFHPLQKSVFVHPFECSKELDFVIEFWKLRPYVRIAEAGKIDNEFHLKNIFGL